MSCGTELLAGLCTTTAVITDLVGARDWLLRRCSKVYAIGGGSNGHGDFCPVHGGKKAYRIIVWVYICVCVYTHTWTWSISNTPFFFQHWPLSTKTSYMPCKNGKYTRLKLSNPWSPLKTYQELPHNVTDNSWGSYWTHSPGKSFKSNSVTWETCQCWFSDLCQRINSKD